MVLRTEILRKEEKDISRQAGSVTRLGDLLDFGHFFKAFGNN